MSGKKNKITFTKPDEPPFITRMKKQFGWKEGPSVDTKREELDQSEGGKEDEEIENKLDAGPTVVVLQEGDLTEEEALEEKKMVDLKPGGVIFKPKDQRKTKGDDTATTSSSTTSTSTSTSTSRTSTSHPSSIKRKSTSEEDKSQLQVKKVNLLSFDEDEDNE